MYHLTTLGSMYLADAGGRPCSTVVRQPKRLALLAYLAVAGPPLLSRDVLLALFWPGLDQVRARNALKSALHLLRKGLHRDVLVVQGPDLVGVREARLWCDARAFRLAVEARRFQDALDLYQGDLLPGLYLRHNLEFERWLEEERAALQRLATDAAARRVDELEARGDVTAAVAAAHRCVSLSGADENSVRRLIVLLDRAGNRAGAIEAFDRCARNLLEDYDLEPSPEMVETVARIRARRDTAPPLAAFQADAVAHPPRALGAIPAPDTDAETRADAPPVVAPMAAPYARWTRFAGRGLAVAGLSMLIGIPAANQRRHDAAMAAPPLQVAVQVQASTGYDEHDHLPRALQSALTIELGRIPVIDLVAPERLQPVDSPANMLPGALSLPTQLLIRGSLSSGGPNATRLDLLLVDQPSGRILHATSIERPEPAARLDVAALAGDAALAVRSQLGFVTRARAWTRAGVAPAVIAELNRADVEVRRAGSLREDAAFDAALSSYRNADSLLARAETLAPSWSQPILERARVAANVGWMYGVGPARQPDVSSMYLHAAILHADRAIDLNPKDPAALELRGTLRYWLWLMIPLSPSEGRAALVQAQADLRAATAIDVDRPRAWSLLSVRLYAEGRFGEAYGAAFRAYETDHFLVHRDEILSRLFRTAIELDNHALSRRWCAEIQRRSQSTWMGADCTLMLIAWSEPAPNAEDIDVWSIVYAGAQASAPQRAGLELRAATVLARMGLSDSATAVIGRATAGAKSQGEMLHLEAEARLALGDIDAAAALLFEYVAERPEHRRGLLASRRFAGVADLVRDRLGAEAAAPLAPG